METPKINSVLLDMVKKSHAREKTKDDYFRELSLINGILYKTVELAAMDDDKVEREEVRKAARLALDAVNEYIDSSSKALEALQRSEATIELLNRGERV